MPSTRNAPPPANSETPVVVVGAGMSGLACALRLHREGKAVQVIEASDGPGGRVRTDLVEGFLLDRGFQVYLSAYPEAGALLDIDALHLQRFKPGSLVFHRGKLRRLMDGLRCPEHAIGTALQPVGSLFDKLRVLRVRHRALHGSPPEPDITTEQFLRESGFSREMVDVFFRSFYGGIFLERELETSARMFLFTFAMFSKGYASLPAKGMAAIPAQLAARLPDGAIRYNTAVADADASGVRLDGGERLAATEVVLATGAGLGSRVDRWRGTSCLYYAAPASPLREPIIALKGSAGGMVNNVCCPSDVAPGYAPPGWSLVSASTVGAADVAELEAKVLAELRHWFGDSVRNWRHLRTYHIPHSLPAQPPSSGRGAAFEVREGVYHCGDAHASASIEGAVISGNAVADAILTGAKG